MIIGKILRIRCPSCHPTNSVKLLSKTIFERSLFCNLQVASDIANGILYYSTEYSVA